MANIALSSTVDAARTILIQLIHKKVLKILLHNNPF